MKATDNTMKRMNALTLTHSSGRGNSPCPPPESTAAAGPIQLHDILESRRRTLPCLEERDGVSAVERAFLACLLTAVLGFFASASVRAQSYSLDWFTFAGGGGTSTGGVYSVSGTIGQPDASGPMTNGQYSVTGGFWAIYAVQTPGAPLLSIERIGGAVRVFWPKPATGFVLDQSLTVTGIWSQVSFPYMTNAADIGITVPSSVGNKFYRLRSP